MMSIEYAISLVRVVTDNYRLAAKQAVRGAHARNPRLERLGSTPMTTTARVKGWLRGLCPPLVWQGASYAVRKSHAMWRRQEHMLRVGATASPAGQPAVDIYWSKDFGDVLDSWGEGTAWAEIRFLLAGRSGRVLDVACGTGQTMRLLSDLPGLEVNGCDISDYLIQRAAAHGIPEHCLKVCDVTSMDYEDGYFDYAYSIGSLEHLDEKGLLRCIAECHRAAKGVTFHQVPVSRSQKDEGWVTLRQSYHNNSELWWRDKFKTSYATVTVLESRWQDDISVGRWFVCVKG